MQQRGGVTIATLGNDALCLVVCCTGCGFGPWSQQVALPEQPVGEVVGAVGVILVIGVDVEQELQVDRNGSGDIDLVEQREEHLCQSQQLWVLRGDVMMQAQSVVQHRAQVIDIEAQEYTKGFYEQVGFHQSSEPFMLDGIPHIKMTWKEYPIETQRLRFRPWQESDAEALFKYAADPDVGPRAGWPPHGSVADSLEVIRKFFSNDHTWALVLKETGEPIGCMGYYPYGESNIGIGENDAELGYWIAKPYWNQGICTEALRAMIDYCFNKKGFQTLWSDFFVDNPASGRVMEKCGFRDTGEINWCSHLYRGDERPVKVMRLDYAL